MDENVLDFPGGAYHAVTLRTYDAAKRQWSIWWIDGRNPSVIDVPVRGAFKDGVGIFACEDTFNGRPIIVHYIWSEITANTARWQQAFSSDEGKTWEFNWDMRFTRAE